MAFGRSGGRDDRGGRSRRCPSGRTGSWRIRRTASADALESHTSDPHGPDFVNTLVIETYLYDDIEVSITGTEVVARYTEQPHTTASIRRTGERTRDAVPIGTRTGLALTASIDGRTVVLVPGSARALKRSYRVRIEIDGRVLTLVATTLNESRLLDGASDTGENAFGDLTRTHDSVEITWAVPFQFMNKTVEPPVPSRDDVLMAVCAAAAFGTGGLSLSTIAMGSVEAVLP